MHIEPAADARLVEHHALAAAGLGLVPVAAVDLVGIGAVQLNMARALCRAHGVRFSEGTGRAVVAALGGAAAPVGVLGALSALKAVPLFGSTAGTVGMWLLGGASTYAMGRTLQTHFEAGGTLEDLDVGAWKHASARWFREGLRTLRARARSRGAVEVREHGHRDGCDQGDSGHDHGHHDHGHPGGGDHADHEHHDHGHHDHAHHRGCDHDDDGHDHDHGGACCDHDHSPAELERYRGRVIIGASTLGGLGLQALMLPGAILPGANLAVAAAATVVIGRRYVESLAEAVKTRAPTTDTLVGTATVASLLLGQAPTALAVVALLNLGEWAEAITLDRTHRAIGDLLDREADGVVSRVTGIVDREREETTTADRLVIGDVVRVRHGQRIPADGRVLAGRGAVDQGRITGEPMPVAAGPGARVYAGSVLVEGELRIDCEQVGVDTLNGRILRMVNDAERHQPRLQRIGERFARRFVPVSFGAAALVLAVTFDPTRALTLLLVACPCAVGLSTPTAVSASVGTGARRGMLARGGQHLETVARADVFAFDKTGTLTRGAPTVRAVIVVDDTWSSTDLLAIAGAVEVHAEHPIARSIVAHARAEGARLDPVERFELVPGSGIGAEVGGRAVRVGSARWMRAEGVPVDAVAAAHVERADAAGETVVWVAVDGRPVGLVTLYDPPREGAAELVAGLRARGKRVVLLSGDQPPAVATLAEAVGISEWHAAQLPDQKRAIIDDLKRQSLTVAMVGDGANDAPALAAADVGISLGTDCAEMAVSVADIAVASDDPRRLLELLHVSEAMTTRIRENYGLAVAVNGGGMIVAALGALGPVGAVVMHNLSSLAVIANSYRLTGSLPDDAIEVAPRAAVPAPA